MEKSLEFIKRNYSPLVLAYMGDSFFETLAREYIINDGDCLVSKLNDDIKKILRDVYKQLEEKGIDKTINKKNLKETYDKYVNKKDKKNNKRKDK